MPLHSLVVLALAALLPSSRSSSPACLAPSILQTQRRLGDFQHSIPTFVINLDRRPDRLLSMGALVATEGPYLRDVCRINAPDAQKFSVATHFPPEIVSDALWSAMMQRGADLTNFRNFTDEQGRIVPTDYTPAKVAVVMAHALAWEHIARSDSPVGMIMEDDILIAHPQARDVLNQAAHMAWMGEGQNTSATSDPQNKTCRQDGAESSEQPRDWDVLQLQLPDGNDSLEGPHAEDNKRRTPTFKAGSDWCLGAYLITRRAARRVLQQSFPIGTQPHSDWSIDAPGKYLRSGNFCRYMSSPELFHQAGSYVDSDGFPEHNAIDTRLFSTRDRCKGHADCPRAIPSCAELDKDKMVVPLLQEAAIAAGLTEEAIK